MKLYIPDELLIRETNTALGNAEETIMQQSNGSKLFQANDPRSTNIGIIEVEPGDDRQSVLTAILTQEKLGRKQIAVLMPTQHSAFRHGADFAGLESLVDKLQAQLIFVAAPSSLAAKFARQHHLPIFASLEKYGQYAQTFLKSEPASISEAEPEQLLQPDPLPIPEETIPPVIDTPIPPSIMEVSTESSPEPIEEALPSSTMTSPKDIVHEPVPAVPLAQRDDLVDVDTQPTHPLPSPPRSEPIIVTSSLHRGNDPILLPVPLSQQPDIIASNPYRGTPPRRRKQGWLLPALLLLLIVLLIGSSLLTIFMGVGPLAQIFPGTAATITITPKSTYVKNTSTIFAITGSADPTKRQIAARFLSSTSGPQSKTVRASGIGTTPAAQAHGILTFYNALSHSQTVPAGTVFTDANGRQVVNDQDAIIDAVQPPTEGTTDVPAHAVLAGASGNIAPLDFNATQCCLTGITVSNAQAFNGGEDQQPYAYVQQNDIDNSANTLKATLVQSSQQALQAQILQSDQLIGDPHCTPTTSADQKAGNKATSVTITTSVICLGEVFDQHGAKLLAESLLKTDATRHPGPDYMLVGDTTSKILQMKVVDSIGTISLQIQAAGTWTYRFPDDWKTQLARQIAGKNASDARAFLQRQTGIQQADVAIDGLNHSLLPTDPSHITFSLVNTAIASPDTSSSTFKSLQKKLIILGGNLLSLANV